MITVEELIKQLQTMPADSQVAIGYDSGIRMNADYVGQAVVDEWDDVYGSKTNLVVITDKAEAPFITQLAPQAIA